MTRKNKKPTTMTPRQQMNLLSAVLITNLYPVVQKHRGELPVEEAKAELHEMRKAAAQVITSFAKRVKPVGSAHQSRRPKPSPKL